MLDGRFDLTAWHRSTTLARLLHTPRDEYTVPEHSCQFTNPNSGNGTTR